MNNLDAIKGYISIMLNMRIHLIKLVFISLFLISSDYVYAQDALLRKHQEWEERINQNYPKLGKKNADGSYTISTSKSRSALGMASVDYSYSSTAAFIEPGNLSKPLCESTITVSKNKITVKIHDVVMVNPDTSDKPIWSEDGSAYGYLSIKPKDPYSQTLGCKGGRRTIKDGGVVIMIPHNSEGEDGFLLTKMQGVGTSICTHNSRRIPIIMKSKDPITGKPVGGYRESDVDHLSPYRFDHNQTISYSWDEIAKENKKNKETIIRNILENDIVGVCIGNDDSFLDFDYPQRDYVRRFLWNLFGYSEERLKKEKADAEKAENERIINEKEQRELAEKAERERRIQELESKYTQASEEFQKGSDKYKTQPLEAYNHFISVTQKIKTIENDLRDFSYEQIAYDFFELWLKTSQRAVQCIYEVSLQDSQYVPLFKKEYSTARNNLDKGPFGSINENIGNKAYNAGLYEDALSFYDIAIDAYHSVSTLNAYEYIPIANKALTLSHLGKKEEAIDWINKSLVLCPDDIYLNQIKGQVLIQNGNKKEAKKWWERSFLPKFGDKAYESKFYKLLREKRIIK